MLRRPFVLAPVWALAWALATASAGLRAQPADPRGALSVVAFGSCAEQHRPQPIWDAVLAQKPQLFLFLGDNIYADTEDMAAMAQEYERLDRIPGFRRLRATTPHWAVWDDHDYGANDGGREYAKKTESQALFLRFWKEPPASPRRSRPGLYDAKVFGPEGRRVQVILLDTRTFRSPLMKNPAGGDEEVAGRYVPDPGPGADLLGEAQWRWLEAQLKEPAELRLLVSSIQVVCEAQGWEKWGNLPAERRRLFEVIRRTGAKGVVILSGDRHFGELAVMDAGLGYPLYDFTSSGLNQGGAKFRYRPADPTRVAAQGQGDNFGVVRIDWSRPDPLVRLECRDVRGELSFQERIPLSLLGVQAAPATARPARPRPGGPPASRR